MKLFPTTVANLFRSESGNYTMRAKLFRKIVQRGLGTKSFEIAKQKLGAAYQEESARLEKKRHARSIGAGMFRKLAAEHLVAIRHNRDIKPRTKKYHREIIRMILRTWPELETKPASMVSQTECLGWGRKMRARYSPSRYNGSVDVLRSVFKIAVEHGVIVKNPAENIPKASIERKELTLPTQVQFQSILKHLDEFNKGRRKQGSVVVRFLAYSGMRMNEAGQVTPDMVDLERGQFNLPGHITKSGKPRSVPIIAEMRPLIEHQLMDYKKSGRKGPLLPCRDPSKSLETCCKLAGATRITNHDLRHLFITRCIESGVDVKTVAEWVGHQDGGALILKTYAHLRNEHSQKMAAKVRFG